MQPVASLFPASSPRWFAPFGFTSRRALFVTAGLIALPHPLRADHIVWQGGNTNWFDDGNWDPSDIPASGDSVTVDPDPTANSGYPATLDTPSVGSDEAALFLSSTILNGAHYRLYRIGDLIIANNFGPLTSPAMIVNLGGMHTENGAFWGWGISTSHVSVGKNGVNGRLNFNTGVWSASSMDVGDNASGYLVMSGSATLQASALSVGNGKIETHGGDMYLTNFFCRNSGTASITGGAINIYNSLRNEYGGNFETISAAIDIGASATAGTDVFVNDYDSHFVQTGSAIQAHGHAVLRGDQYVSGQGAFSADSTTLNTPEDTFKSFTVSGNGVANLGALEIGTEIHGANVYVGQQGKLTASSVNMGRCYSLDVPVNQPESLLTIKATAQVSGAMNLGLPDHLDLGSTTSGTYGAPAKVIVSGGTLSAASMSLSQSKTGTASLAANTGGKITVAGDLAIGDSLNGSATIDATDASSEISANRLWIGRTAGAKGVASVANGGSLRAFDRILIGPQSGQSDASLVIGGEDTANGGLRNPGQVNAPLVARAGSTAVNSRVIFQHGAADYSFTPAIQDVDTVSSTGTGRSSLEGQLRNIGSLVATGGTLATHYGAAANTANFVAASGSGTIEINASTVKTPVVALPRTIIGTTGSGTVTVTNGGRLESSIVVGNLGATNFGHLNVQGSNSSILVQGAGLVVGNGGQGALNVSDGGHLINNAGDGSSAQLGYMTGGTGSAIITGNGSRWDVGALTLGLQGTGNASVSTLSTLAANSLLLGDQAGSSGYLVVGSSSNVQVAASSVIAGNAGSGRIVLKDAGRLKIGPSGNGDLILKNQGGGTGELDIGDGSASPGFLSARSVYSGSAGSGSLVKISHQLEGYAFTPTLTEVSLQIASGHTGTTALTAPNNFLSHCSVTSGGLRLSQGGNVMMDDELVIGDGGTVDLDNYALPYLEVDGQTTKMDAGFGILVGKNGDGEVRLKNGGTLSVHDSSRQAIDSVILGDDKTTLGHSCAVVFGGSATTSPGVLDALGIQSYASDGKVVFNHSANNFTLAANLGGSLKVQQQAGTTLLTGGMAYTGATTVSGGTLLTVNNLNSIVSVASGATFGGRGTVARVNLASGSTLSPGTFVPGAEIATQRITALNFFGGSKVQIDLGANGTCDEVLNHDPLGGSTTLFPITSGNLTFQFRNRGINRNGVYPVMTTANVLSSTFMSHLLFTADFPLQGSFQQTRITNDPKSTVPYTQLEFVVSSYGTRSPYQIWAEDTYGLALVTTGAVDADPDHDGVLNMMEFVLGSSPVAQDSSRLPMASVAADGALKFSFNRRLMLDGYFTTAVEYSTDLSTWATAPSSMLSAGAADADGFEPVTCTIPLPAGAKRLFGRLRVTQVQP